MAKIGSSAKPYQLDAKSRVAISPEARSALGVGPGDFVTYEVDGKSVRIRKVKISIE